MADELCGRALTCCLIGSLLLSAGSPAAAQEPLRPSVVAANDAAPAAPGTVRRAMETAALLAGGLSVRLNKTYHREGDRIEVSIDIPREGYLNVLSIGADGVARVLFPHPLQADNRVGVGTFRVPTAQMKQDLKATGPYGPTVVAAFLSKEPLDLRQGGAGERDEQGRAPEPYVPLAEEGKRQVEDLAGKSFALTPRAAPLLGGMAYGAVCAAQAACDAASLAAAELVGKTDERLVPGILLEPEIELALPQGVRLRRVSDKGIALSKLSEGFAGRLYNAVGGHCSIAYGHLVKKASCDGSEPVALQRGLNRAQGEMLLVEDMRRAQRAVASLVTTELTDAQFAALCDFTYNVGADKLQKSTLLKAINAGEHRRVPFQLRRWTVVGGKEYAELKIRREREIALYFEGTEVPETPTPEDDLTLLDIRLGEAGLAGGSR